MDKQISAIKGGKNFEKEWDEITSHLRKYFSAKKSTVKENGGKTGRNGQD